MTSFIKSYQKWTIQIHLVIPDPDVSLDEDGLPEEDQLRVGRDQGPLRVEDVDQLLEHRLDRQDILEHHTLTHDAVEMEVNAGRTYLLSFNLKFQLKNDVYVHFHLQMEHELN